MNISSKLYKYCLSFSTGSLFAGVGYWKWKSDQSRASSVTVLTKQNTSPMNYEKVKQIRHDWEISNFFQNEQISSDEAVTVLFSRANQIKEIYEKTHFVFIHAQSTSFYPLVSLINFEAHKQSPKKPFFKHIRMPLSEQYLELLIKQAVLLSKKGEDHVEDVREHIVSADLYFPNKGKYDSAYDFLKRNHSIHEPMVTIAYDILSKNDKISEKNAWEMSRKIGNLGDALKKVSPCGTLWVFCIPKSQFASLEKSDVAYRSHPFGQVCRCHEGSDNREIAQKLQDNILDASTRCDAQPDPVDLPFPDRRWTLESMTGLGIVSSQSPSADRVPQYRLVMPNIKAEKGAFCFMVTPFSKNQRRAIKEEVKKTIENPAYNPSLPALFVKNELTVLSEELEQLRIDSE